MDRDVQQPCVGLSGNTTYGPKIQPKEISITRLSLQKVSNIPTVILSYCGKSHFDFHYWFCPILFLMHSYNDSYPER